MDENIGFPVHKGIIRILFGNALSKNIAETDFEPAKEIRLFQRDEIATISDGSHGRKIIFIKFFEENSRNAGPEKIVGSGFHHAASKEKSVIQLRFVKSTFKQSSSSDSQGMVLRHTEFPRQVHAKIKGVQVETDIQAASIKERRKFTDLLIVRLTFVDKEAGPGHGGNKHYEEKNFTHATGPLSASDYGRRIQIVSCSHLLRGQLAIPCA